MSTQEMHHASSPKQTVASPRLLLCISIIRTAPHYISRLIVRNTLNTASRCSFYTNDTAASHMYLPQVVVPLIQTILPRLMCTYRKSLFLIHKRYYRVSCVPTASRCSSYASDTAASRCFFLHQRYRPISLFLLHKPTSHLVISFTQTPPRSFFYALTGTSYDPRSLTHLLNKLNHNI